MTPDREAPQFCGRLSRGFISSLVTSRHGPAHNGRRSSRGGVRLLPESQWKTSHVPYMECDFGIRVASTGSGEEKGSIFNPVALCKASLKTPRAWENIDVPDRAWGLLSAAT